MARGPAARCPARGGEGIPPARQARARITAAVASVGLVAALTVWLALSTSGSLRSWSLVVAAPAAPFLAAALALRRPVGIPVAIVLLATAYTLRLLVDGDTLDESAPILAGALLTLAELGYWSLELREGVAEEAGAHVRRVAVLAALALGAVVLGLALLGLVETATTGGLAAAVAGAAAAVTAVALLAWASRGGAP